MDGEINHYDYNAEQLKAFAKMRDAVKQPTIQQQAALSNISPQPNQMAANFDYSSRLEGNGVAPPADQMAANFDYQKGATGSSTPLDKSHVAPLISKGEINKAVKDSKRYF